MTGLDAVNAQNQDKIARFIMDEKNWNGVVPTRCDTHISTVFLVGDLAFKLKKAVHLPFLDFSTLALRQQSCQRELDFNRLWAPELYVGSAQITQSDDGALHWDGPGQVVESLVVMHRFADDQGLAQILAAGQAHKTMITDLMQTLWRGYGRAEIYQDAGGAKGFSDIIDGLEPSFTQIPHDLFDAWRKLVTRHAARLDQRRNDGWVRRCHGDLHLGNVCLYQGKLLPFDVLEFNDSLAIIDVAYDMAFLLMDMLAHGYDDFAALVMNRYLDVSGDYNCVALLPLMVSLRAGVRAMVMQSLNDQAQARIYLDLARQVLEPRPAQLLAIGGLSGSGKSHLSWHLSVLMGRPGAAVIRSDAIRKRLMGVAQTDRLGPEGYDAAVTQQVYEILYGACAQILSDHLPVIADAVFSRPEEREAIARCGQPFTGLWLDVSLEAARSRVAKRQGDVSDATIEVVEQQHGRDVGPMTWACIDTSGPKEQTLSAAAQILGLSSLR